MVNNDLVGARGGDGDGRGLELYALSIPCCAVNAVAEDDDCGDVWSVLKAVRLGGGINTFC